MTHSYVVRVSASAHRVSMSYARVYVSGCLFEERQVLTEKGDKACVARSLVHLCHDVPLGAAVS